MSCEQHPNFVEYDRWSKIGRNRDGGENPAGTKILRQMHLVKPSDIPPRDFGMCVAAPTPRRKGKK